jgi:large repetitive protein
LTSPAGLSGVSVTYSQNGLTVASPIAVGTYQVMALLDNPDYTAHRITGTMTINPAGTRTTPIITWPNPAGITYGTPLSSTQLDATASVPGTFSYSPPLGTVLQAGNDQKLSVNFTPTDTTDYTSATDTVYIDVENPNRSVPTIAWANPVGITYGTPLSSSQLDATASVSGTFSYSPAVDTILDAGNNQTLSVTFTPTDTADYATASESVPISVAPAQASLSFGNLSFTYDGLPQSTSITTSPIGLAGVSVKYTDNGLAVASPTAVGSYQVTASLDNPNYTAQPIMGTMTITQPTTLTPTQTVIIGEQPFFQRKLNKKGKPTGKAVLSGFTLDFGVALNAAAAANAANYQIDAVTIKKVKKKKETVLQPIANFAVSYIAASDAVQITLGSNQTFPTGGQITILGGLTTASGATLTGPAVFTIAKGGRSVVPS